MKPFDSEIIFCDNHLLIARKAPGLLTQPDESGNGSLETFAKEWIKREYKKEGGVFLHAIHRLDKPVSGLVLFARTSKALTRLNELSRNQQIQRTYLAELEGILPAKEGKLDHYLIHGDHRAVVSNSSDKKAKHARLIYRVAAFKDHTTIAAIELETGRYHQIRAQFSASGHPVVGDLRYGAGSGDGVQIHLHSFRLAFQHPVTREVVQFESPPPFAS